MMNETVKAVVNVVVFYIAMLAMRAMQGWNLYTFVSLLLLIYSGKELWICVEKLEKEWRSKIR